MWLWIALAAANPPVFPPLRGSALDGGAIVLPASQPSVVLLGFERSHSRTFDAWRPTLATLDQEGLAGWYEVPFIHVGWPLKGIIGGAMRSQSDPDQLAHTMPIWDSGAPVAEALSLDPSKVAVVLVDGGGTVLWTGSGAPTPAAILSLREALH
jgi:hypothetical protein